MSCRQDQIVSAALTFEQSCHFGYPSTTVSICLDPIRMPNLVLLEEVDPAIDRALKREMILLRNFGFDVSFITGK